jgi:MYXO-CTERM domain-containing protein
MIDSEDGCGCASTDSTGGGLFGLALLLGVGRRRRR